jgi:hypothetical protein
MSIASDNDGIEDDEEFSNEFDEVPISPTDIDVDEDEEMYDETEE